MSTHLTPLRGQVSSRTSGLRATSETQVVLLASGKAGQGTSTVAALLAILSAAEGARVLLVDAGAGAATLPDLLGVFPAQAPTRALDASASLEEMVVPISDTLSLLSVAGAAVGASAGAGVGERRALLRWLPPLYARYDLVVLDGGSRLESILALTAYPPARVLAVTTCDRIAVPSTYALIKALDVRSPGLPVEVLVNSAPAEAALTVFRELDTATQLFLQRRVDYAGAVPDDDGLRAATGAGIPVQQAAIDSPVVSAIHQLAARVQRELVHRTPAVSEPHLARRR
ncbi:MAG: hypothetical protein KY464_00660 [Gemmatimonadetes bacterium]|nr:hypothetical protein [Gemmatimonadota bacterium]